MVTEKLTFDGKYLFVNADVHNKKGVLAVEDWMKTVIPFPDIPRKNVLHGRK